jgi:hypothetical protein
MNGSSDKADVNAAVMFLKDTAELLWRTRVEDLAAGRNVVKFFKLGGYESGVEGIVWAWKSGVGCKERTDIKTYVDPSSLHIRALCWKSWTCPKKAVCLIS